MATSCAQLSMRTDFARSLLSPANSVYLLTWVQSVSVFLCSQLPLVGSQLPGTGLSVPLSVDSALSFTHVLVSGLAQLLLELLAVSPAHTGSISWTHFLSAQVHTRSQPLQLTFTSASCKRACLASVCFCSGAAWTLSCLCCCTRAASLYLELLLYRWLAELLSNCLM